jgi:uncharacterized protein (DUF4415 family)
MPKTLKIKKTRSDEKSKPVLVRKPVNKPIPKKSFHPAEQSPAEDQYETKQVNIRLPENVLDYFRDNYSPGYQTKIKEVLREYMEENPR